MNPLLLHTAAPSRPRAVRAGAGQRQRRGCSISHLSSLISPVCLGAFLPCRTFRGEALGAVSHRRTRSPAAGQGEGAATRDPQPGPGLCAQQLPSPPAQAPQALGRLRTSGISRCSLCRWKAAVTDVWGRRSQMRIQPGGWEGGGGGGEENWVFYSGGAADAVTMPRYRAASVLQLQE